MISKNALLAGLAGAFVFAAPALAQETPAQDASTPTAAEQPAQPSSLTLTPGSSVKSKDGTELGKLVGVQAGASGQELTVRGADGQVRGVAVSGIEAQGSDIMVDATMADFQAAAPIAGEAPAEAVPADAAAPTDDAAPVSQPMPAEEPMTEPADPVTEPDA